MTIREMLVATCDECGTMLQSGKSLAGLADMLKKEGWLTVHWAEAESRNLRHDGLNSHYCKKCRKAMEKKMPGLGTL